MTEGVRHLEKAFEHGYPDAQIALGIERISLQTKLYFPTQVIMHIVSKKILPKQQNIGKHVIIKVVICIVLII